MPVDLNTIASQTDTLQDGDTLVYKKVDGNPNASQWIVAPNSSGPVGPAGGDLALTFPNPSVIGLQGHAVSSTAPSDGYVLQWSASTSRWTPAPAASSSTHFLGDLLSLAAVSTRTSIYVDGYSSVNDGGQGTFFWQAGSGLTSDGGTIIVPTGITTGAWIRDRQSQDYNVLWFGNLSTTSTPANGIANNNLIDAVIAAATATNTVNPSVYIPPAPAAGEYPLERPIQLCKTLLTLRGAPSDTSVSNFASTGTILRVLYNGPAIINTPTVTSAQMGVTQDGSTGFYGLALGSRYLMISDGYAGSLNAQQAFTVEFWLQATTGASGVIMASAGQRGLSEIRNCALRIQLLTNNTITFGITTTNNPITLNNNTGVSVTTSIAAASGVRTKFEASYDGSFLRTYVNGVYAGKVACTGAITQSYFEQLMVGCQSSQWPFVGGFTFPAASCTIYSIRLSHDVARHTSEITPYTPETSQITTCDNNTQLLLNFDPSLQVLPAGMFTGFIQYSALGMVANPTYLVCFGATQGQLSGATVRDINSVGGLNYGVSGFLGNLCPNITITNCNFSNNGGVGISLYNNCYLSKVERCGTASNHTAPGVNCWGLGMFGAAGLLEIRRCQFNGGIYCMVGNQCSGLYEDLYTIASTIGNYYFVNQSGNGLNTQTFTNCYPGNESGFQSDSTIMFNGGPYGINFFGGGIEQTSNTTSALVTIDSDPVDGGNYVFSTAFKGTGTNPFLSFPTPTQRPVLVLMGDANNLDTSVGVIQPWIDGYHPGYVLIPEQETRSTSVNVTSAATIPVSINKYLHGTINVYDPSGILPADGYVLQLPLNDNGRIRTINNYTGRSLTVQGVTGSGGTLAAHSTTTFQCLGSIWQKQAAEVSLSSFVPTSLPGCVLWLNAGAGVTQSGTVSAWTDQSGAGNSATSSGAAKPTYVASSTHLNGLPSISYSGTNSMTIANAASLQLTGDFTFATVVYETTANLDNCLISKGASGEFDLFCAASVAFEINRNGIITSFGGASIVVNTPTIVVISSKNNVITIAVNGAKQVNGCVPYVGTFTTTNNAVTIGERSDSVTFLTGEQPEVILYNQAQAHNDIAQLTSYLGNKYAITYSTF